MKQIILGAAIGLILGASLLYSSIYIVNLNTRIMGIEKFLNNAIQQSQQQQQSQQRVETAPALKK
jgi:hypothetical protein